MDFDLIGKVVLVTGSGRGIGLAEARPFFAEGARLAINGVDPRRAEQAASIRATGGTAEAFAADVTRPEGVQALFDRIATRLGACQVLVNDAGLAGGPLGPAADRIPQVDWAAVVHSHLRATWLCTRAAVPAMRAARWGRIVNTSSIHHTGGGPPRLAA